jgi:hypothetical protein
MTAILSEAEAAFYRDNGYVAPACRLPADALEALRAGVDRMIADNPDTRPEYLINPHMAPWPDGANPFLAAARRPDILDMVERLIGPDLILWITRILSKPAGDGQEVPWHQDGEYWPIRPLATCSVWLAVDPSTAENGCMRVIPGSHAGARLYSHHRTGRDNLVLNLEIDADQFDQSRAVDIALEPGQMSLHDVRLIHGSRANRSRRRRAGVIFRYMPATSLFDRSLGGEIGTKTTYDIFDQPLWLVRGEDRTGRNDFTCGHDVWARRYRGA